MPPEQNPPDHDLLARLLYRDGLILIVDKPAGVPVHAAPGGGPSLEQSFEALRFGLPRPPALAHRLDRDTSGCLALGRHRKALAQLGRLFAGNRVGKTYWALVRGTPPEPAGRIDLALAKPDRGRVVPDRSGRTAVTDYRVRAATDEVSWLELHPVTGRTHQIRVHCAALGCPVVGDRLYGPAGPADPPLQLHARALEIPLYPKRAPVEAAAPLPPHMASVFARAGITAADAVSSLEDT